MILNLINPRVWILTLPASLLALAGAGCGDSGPGETTASTSGESESEPTSETETGGMTEPTTAGPTTTASMTEPTTVGPTTEPTTSATTEPAICGNAVLEAGEQCDDGNDVEGDGCESDCTLSPGDAYWTRTHDESGAIDEGVGVATDGVGNVYVVANVEDDINQQDIWIRKYDPTGVSLWTQQYDGGAGSIDSVAAVTSDDAGFMIAVGRQSTDGMGSDFWLSQCDPQGQILWAFTDPGPISGSDITMLGSDFVVTGSIKQNNDDNAWIRRYDGGGSEIWTRVFEGADDGPDVASSVAVDGAGNILVAGRTFTMAASFNIWIRRYDPDGMVDWTVELDGPVGGVDWANGIAHDPVSGEIAAVGRVDGAGDSVDIWIGKFDGDGAQLWEVIHDDSGETDLAHDVAIDSAGNIVVVGQSEFGGQDDIWIGKYSGAGDELWIESYGHEAGEEDVARAVAVDPFDDIVTVGHETLIASFNSDVWVNKREP